MEIQYTFTEIIFYMLFYSFLGWVMETIYFAIKERRFRNVGFTNMPFCMTYGINFTLLMILLPTLKGNYVYQFIITLVIVSVTDYLSRTMLKQISHEQLWRDDALSIFSGNGSAGAVILTMIAAGGYYIVYLLVHPLLRGLVYMIPVLVVKIIVYTLVILLLADYVSVFTAVRAGNKKLLQQSGFSKAKQNLGNRITDAIWKRLQRAYPGFREMNEEERAGVTFAKGMCFDKLIWVFLISALLGDVIETFYCRFAGGVWMSRSSVLYGPFSVVWGLGAVVLTVTLQKFAQKDDRYVFIAGFFIGGVYEYMCSVFTEIVFGTVFWDYSDMPLNIGGRTNVLYCMFWGILSVVWIKLIYPYMSKGIEKLPPLAGKIITWVVILLMACNGILTMASMVRYNVRQTNPEPKNVIEQFLDEQYDDAFMEKRWQNMKIAQEK